MAREDTDRDRDRDDQGGADVRGRVEQASGGEVVSGLEAEAAEPSEDRPVVKPGEPDRPTAEEARAAKRRLEEMQQSGEGIHGVSTEGREDQGDEDAIREATEGKE